MKPVLAHYRQLLTAGPHPFVLHWRVPERRAGATVYLTFTWSGSQPPAEVAGPVAVLRLA
jgi:hypothetical protein